MKAQRLTDIGFCIEMLPNDECGLNLNWKDGEMFLTLSDILVKENDAIYDVPIRDIQYINIIENKKPKLQIGLGSIDVYITSNNRDHLQALRHFLMPFIAEPAK